MNPQPNGYRLGLNYVKKQWDAGVDLTMVSGRDLKYYTSANYCVLNLFANYTVNKSTRLYFKWNNITNQAYEATGSTTPGLYPMPSSTWQLGIKYTF
jgi:outer membrane receptor protein involved in Fe transport